MLTQIIPLPEDRTKLIVLLSWFTHDFVKCVNNQNQELVYVSYLHANLKI